MELAVRRDVHAGGEPVATNQVNLEKGNKDALVRRGCWDA